MPDRRPFGMLCLKGPNGPDCRAGGHAVEGLEEPLARQHCAVQLTPSDQRHPGAVLGEAADDADDLALDLDLGRVDRLHLGIGRLETDSILLTEVALECDAVILE